jgi:carbon-monoxide dehydrogenase small subunit
MTERHEITATVNGKKIAASVEARMLLADFLRDQLRLTGTHVGCEHGICGACTILFNGHPARSCLTFAIQIDGQEVWTVEGLSDTGALAQLQQAFSKHHALQCGFCTPGMLITAYDFLRHQSSPTEKQVREGMSASLCRCTGYQGIVRAVCEVAGEQSAASSSKPPRDGEARA